MTRQCASCGVQTASPDLPACPLCGGSWHDDEAVLAKLMRRFLELHSYYLGTDWLGFDAHDRAAEVHLDPGDQEALSRVIGERVPR